MSRTDGAPALITVFMLMSVSAALKTTNNVSQDLFVTASRAFRVQSKYLYGYKTEMKRLFPLASRLPSWSRRV